MSGEAHNWQKAADKLRRALGLSPPTPAEADKAIREAAEIPMTPEEIADIVGRVTRGEVPPAVFHPDHGWADQIDTGHMVEDSKFVMNRNAGDADEEVDADIERLRQEGLEDDNENSSGNEDGTAGGGRAPGSRP